MRGQHRGPRRVDHQVESFGDEDRRGLGLDDRGTIEPGKLADLAVWNVQSPAELSYALGHNPCRQVFKAGVPRNCR